VKFLSVDREVENRAEKLIEIKTYFYQQVHTKELNFVEREVWNLDRNLAKQGFSQEETFYHIAAKKKLGEEEVKTILQNISIKLYWEFLDER